MYEEKEIQYKKRKKEKAPKEKRTKNLAKKEKEKKIDKKKNTNVKKVITKKTPSIKKRKIKKKCLTLPPILTEIDYKLLFFKLLILLLMMMLIIFTTARIKKHQEKQNEILNANINTITNATLEYYEKNSLPINVGDSSSFLLEEMKNLNLIQETKDEENKFCNYLDSYIILTKTANMEYRLKIYLKCPSKEKTVEEKIICQGNHCTIKK